MFFYICAPYLVSHEFKNWEGDEAITEWTGVHEIPKSVVLVEAISWTRNDCLQYATNHVRKQLKEEGGDIDDLRPELLQQESASASIIQCG